MEVENKKKVTVRLKTVRKFVVYTAIGVLLFGAGYQVGISGSGWQRNGLPGGDQIGVLAGLPVSMDGGGDSQSGVNMDEFWVVWNKVKANYIDSSKTDNQKMVYGAIKGMVESVGDPYTVFLLPDENKRSRDDLRGSFYGVGIQLGYKDDPETNEVERQLAVIAPLKDMPAEKAGILSGDLILAVDGQSTAKMSVPEAVEIIRGPQGTSVELTMYRKGDTETRKVSLVRDEIVVPSVDLEFIGEGNSRVAHLRLSRFGERTEAEFNDAVGKIVTEYDAGRAKGVVLDLRGNPGGYFQGAINVVSEFVNSGVIVQQEDATGERAQFKAKGNARLKDVPVVVLVNQGSASSSEITAGAIKELRSAPVVGMKSFGKGTVQQAEDLPDGAGLHITTNRWLLPSGTWIDKNGVSPDVEVEYDPQASAGQKVDNQLGKAIEVLLGR